MPSRKQTDTDIQGGHIHIQGTRAILFSDAFCVPVSKVFTDPFCVLGIYGSINLCTRRLWISREISDSPRHNFRQSLSPV